MYNICSINTIIHLPHAIVLLKLEYNLQHSSCKQSVGKMDTDFKSVCFQLTNVGLLLTQSPNTTDD